MKRFFAGLFLLCALLFTCAAAEKPELLYFFENYCATCNPQEEFALAYYEQTGETLEGYDCAFYNIRYPQARDTLEKTAAAYGIQDPVLHLPLLIVGGEAYPGDTFPGAEAAVVALPETMVRGESRVLYLYVAACEGCRRAAQVLDALPGQVQIERGGETLVSPVRIIRQNIADDPQSAQRLFEAYQVPPERQTAPMVLVGETWLGGAEEIESKLPRLLADGAGLEALLEESEGNRINALDLSWPGALLAGLVGGLNPCALSMLLLFLTLLVGQREKLVSGSVAYLSAKFITYLLIGTVLYGVFLTWNPSWLPLAVKVLTTVFCVVLIILNVRDAWASSREAYGQVRNQLPSKLRTFLHGRIRETFAGRVGMVSIALLGVVVAASEFLCAGQVYLATLLSALHAQVGLWEMLPQLVLYCAGFLLPSILVCLLVGLGKNLLDISEFFRKHMPAIKMVTAGFFLVMLLLIWWL